MADRLAACEQLQDGDCVSCLTIDDVELHTLRTLIERSMGLSSLLGCVTIKNNPAGRTGTVGMSVMHEYALFYGANETTRVGRLEHSSEQKARYKESDEGGAFEWTNFRKHGGANTFREKRPRQFYPIYVDGDAIRIPKMTWDNTRRAYDVLEQPSASEVTLYPIDNQGRDRIWDFVVDTARKQLSHLRVKKDGRGEVGVYRKWRINPEGMLPPTVWDKSKYSAAEYGTNLLSRMFGATQTFAFPKSVHAVEDCLRVAGLGMNETGIALDYFAGSGTTAHAVMNLNREDDGQRRFILIEMGEHFNTVLKPRIAKVVYSPDWKDGKAQSHDKGLSSLVKVLQLESYEDTLNNLRLARTSNQQSLLDANPTVAEEYTLNYVLDEETKGSPSLLNVEAFDKPFEYTLNIATGTVGESRATKP
jgi:adenine-specific DNA-methyltransferase